MALNFTSLMTTAIENRSSSINDALSKSNALLYVLRKHGGVKAFDGGLSITENVNYSEAGANAQAYSGYDVLNTNRGEHLTMAQFSIAQYASSVSISGLEVTQNAGKSRILDLLESRITAAEKALTNKISGDLYGDGTNANSLTGIQAMLTLTPAAGTYGGISRLDNTFWRHSAATGTAITAANVYTKFRDMQNSLMRGTDKPHVIVSCMAHYGLLDSYFQAQQRFESVGKEEYTNLGFTNLMFRGIPLFFENNAFGASGMPADQSYILNLDTVKLRPFKTDKFMKWDGSPTNQDVTVSRMKWYGNLTCSNLALNGVIQG